MICLLADWTCGRLYLNALGDSFDFTNVSRPDLLVMFQHDEDLPSLWFFLDV